MDEGLQEIDGEDVAHSVAYALKRDRKGLQRLQPRDDEGHFRAARRIIDQLKLSGVRFSGGRQTGPRGIRLQATLSVVRMAAIRLPGARPGSGCRS